jgi:hypothetical protein
MKCFVLLRRFMPEIAALICFAIVTATEAGPAATRLIVFVALAVILAIEFGPERIELSRQKRRDRAKALLGGGRSKGSR